MGIYIFLKRLKLVEYIYLSRDDHNPRTRLYIYIYIYMDRWINDLVKLY